MAGYESKQALIAEIEKTAALYIKEFEGIPETDRDQLMEGVDRTPAQMIAYQLGWLDLIMGWDRDEAEGKQVITPPRLQMEQLGRPLPKLLREILHILLSELQELFKEQVTVFVDWLASFSEEDVFTPGSRKWASSTPSNWPVWRWVHINTVSPFTSLRSKIRKWKKLNASV